jgi:hypothetical protein
MVCSTGSISTTSMLRRKTTLASESHKRTEGGERSGIAKGEREENGWLEKGRSVRLVILHLRYEVLQFARRNRLGEDPISGRIVAHQRLVIEIIDLQCRGPAFSMLRTRVDGLGIVAPQAKVVQGQPGASTVQLLSRCLPLE